MIEKDITLIVIQMISGDNRVYVPMNYVNHNWNFEVGREKWIKALQHFRSSDK